jgi:hypothetical protein
MSRSSTSDKDMPIWEFQRRTPRRRLYALAGIPDVPWLYRSIEIYLLLSAMAWALSIWLPTLRDHGAEAIVFWNSLVCVAAVLLRYPELTRRKPTNIIPAALIPLLLYVLFTYVIAPRSGLRLDRGLFVLVFVALYWRRAEREILRLAYARRPH